MSPLDRASPPTPGPVRPFSFPDAERETLEHGLDLVVARHGDLPLVTAELVVDAGAASDPAQKAGLAQLASATLESGTESRSADEVAWEIERLGVELESRASWDAAVLRITVPRERLGPALELFADLVRRPSFPEREVARLRDQQLATILQRRKEPGALANDMAAKFIFAPDVPYARPRIGTSGTVEGLGRADVERFWREHYLPNASALFFVGDVDRRAARELADRHFGDWQSGAARPPQFDVAVGVEEATVFIVDRPGAVQSEIRIGDVGVERGHEDYFPLQVMNTLLGGAFTSRLNMNLRERHGFTYGAKSGFAFRREPGPFVVRAAVGTDVTGPAVREALSEIRSLRDEGAEEDEVASARDYLRGILPLRLQTTQQLATRLADLFVYDLPADYFDDYRERIADVTADEVARVARTHLRPERFAVVVVGDSDRIEEPLRELEIGRVRSHETDAAPGA